MSTKMHVKSSESGVVRVFHIDLPRQAIERFTTQAGTGEWPLQYALGAKSLRSDFVEVVDIRDLGTMRLSQYLAQAHDIHGPDFDAMRPHLDALKGHVLIMASQAFDQTEQDLTISSPVRWIGTFNEPKAASATGRLRSPASTGTLSGTRAPASQKIGSGVWVLFALFAIVACGIIAAKFLVN